MNGEILNFYLDGSTAHDNFIFLSIGKNFQLYDEQLFFQLEIFPTQFGPLIRPLNK